jgi:hypothetical protein
MWPGIAPAKSHFGKLTKQLGQGREVPEHPVFAGNLSER